MGNNNAKKEAECVPEMQRLSYDLSPLQELKLPVVCIVGAPGTGCCSQSTLIEETYGFNLIKISTLLRSHANNETDRGRVIKENMEKELESPIPDAIIVDLIKEEMLLRYKYSNGFLLSGFPHNRIQARMFIDEIYDVTAIIHLHCDLNTAIKRLSMKKDRFTEKQIKLLAKRLKKELKPFLAKLEKCNSKDEPKQLFRRVQSALNVRIYGNSQRKNGDEVSMARHLKLVILILPSIVFLNLAMRECLNNQVHRNYFKIKKCHRSDQTIISRNNYNDLKECINYAREKNGLAFNFSPPEAKRNKTTDYFYNCVVLGCPESSNQTTLISDPAFDYYSAYGNFTLLINSTCVKSIGVFKLVRQKENYTEAILRCQEVGADLAHILTETRTNSLSDLISGFVNDWYKVAYVGLDDISAEGSYETPLGDPLDCYNWRAWSPGHPKNVIKSDDCVVLDNERSWKVVNCKNKLPFLCEYYHTAPSPNKTANVECEDLEDDEQIKSCKEERRKKNKKRRKGRRNRCDED